MPLSLDGVSVNNPNDIFFQFHYLDDATGNQIAGFGFRSWEDHGFTQYSAISSDLQAGGDNAFIPVHENDAVLMTVTTAPSTWAVTNYVVRLTLHGIMTWEWNATFDNPIFPFRLDGTWIQKW
jgi:hypothetical protein